METLHKVNFLNSVILWGVIIKYVELFTYKIFNNIKVIMITMCLYSQAPSSYSISQPRTTEDFVHSCQGFEHLIR